MIMSIIWLRNMECLEHFPWKFDTPRQYLPMDVTCVSCSVSLAGPEKEKYRVTCESCLAIFTFKFMMPALWG